MKRLIAYFVSGVRTGSFFYLALLLLGQLFPQLIYPKVSVGNILALFMMSGLMGMLSWILEEIDCISYRLRIILHFLLTAIVLTVTCLISGWYEDRTLLLFVFGVIIPCLYQHRLSCCKCPQHPSDLFDEWDNGGLDIHS